MIPRNHSRNLYDAPDEDLAHTVTAAKRLALRMRDTLGCDGINLLNSCEPAAWQTVFHLHIHVIPRYEDDPLRLPGSRSSPRRASWPQVAASCAAESGVFRRPPLVAWCRRVGSAGVVETCRCRGSDSRCRTGRAHAGRKVHVPTGTVKWFNDEKGYGFITPDDGDRDLFVHYTGIDGQGFKSLTENSKVEYEEETATRVPRR